ncbi:MAG: hypothetical protein Q3983_09340 [Capnocytophaga sp.]|nr:hypothetical protein [Capnocytophaga sp.]
MKYLKYIGILSILCFWGCTTKSDTYYNRQFQMIPTMYNVLYNGNLAFEEGKREIENKYTDNYYDILKVEPITMEEDMGLDNEENPLFVRAEEKAIKAIQKHSMVFDGKQKNRKIDDAYMLLGKARFYNGRFIPALEAFNHLLTNYGETNQRYNAAVWREKTHIQLGREQLAIQNLNKILSEEKLKKQERADLQAVKGQAYINLKNYKNAIESLKIAGKQTKKKTERGRYFFIIGQLYEQLNEKDSATIYFDKVVKLNWNIPRRLWLEAQTGKARNQSLTPEEKEKYIKLLHKMEKLYEHKNFLDIVHFQYATFYENEKQNKRAISHYIKSLKENQENNGLKKLSHEHLAELYFTEKNYPLAYQHYDSTLVYMPDNTLDYLYVRRKRDNLTQITEYENIVHNVDSISKIVKMDESQKVAFFQKYIDSLAKNEKKEELKITNFGKNSNEKMEIPKDIFYFYSPQTIAYGKQFFENHFGDRPLTDNWRWSNVAIANFSAQKETDTIEKQRITPQKFIEKLPSLAEIETLETERDRALYQLGILYWEKFKEDKLATSRLERILQFSANQELIEKSLYQLYKVNEEKNPQVALQYKEELSKKYPESEYSKILAGTKKTNEKDLENKLAELEQLFENQQFLEIISEIDKMRSQYKVSPQAPDWEILKAKAKGRLEGVATYTSELEKIAEEYPNTKQAVYIAEVLKTLRSDKEKPNFIADELATSWKIVTQPLNNEELKKIDLWIDDNGMAYLKITNDVYDASEKWLVIHGFFTKRQAENFVKNINLQEQENYRKLKKIKNKSEIIPNVDIFKEFFIISSENYNIIQMYKNKNEYH